MNIKIDQAYHIYIMALQEYLILGGDVQRRYAPVGVPPWLCGLVAQEQSMEALHKAHKGPQ